MIDLKEISIVVQGAVNEQTPECLKSIREYLPDAEIVLSTYIGSDINGLDYDKVVLVEDPGFYLFDNNPKHIGVRKNNVSRQIQTTLAGLKTATRKYAFKLRSDFAMTGYGFLDYFDKFPKSDPDYKVFKHKILSSVFFARNPYKHHPFHPSDIAF
ncbi:MAG: WavE lipopolysaccharide synthesis family protein, partial [Campylobacteraceae bacterium]|nr:WavE lipopolysaccharide synthesis family protein [Campylobacteraceae bacterium]